MPRDAVKAYIKEGRECQMMHTKFNQPVELHPIAVLVHSVKHDHEVGMDIVSPLPPCVSGKLLCASCKVPSVHGNQHDNYKKRVLKQGLCFNKLS